MLPLVYSWLNFPPLFLNMSTSVFNGTSIEIKFSNFSLNASQSVQLLLKGGCFTFFKICDWTVIMTEWSDDKSKQDSASHFFVSMSFVMQKSIASEILFFSDGKYVGLSVDICCMLYHYNTVLPWILNDLTCRNK